MPAKAKAGRMKNRQRGDEVLAAAAAACPHGLMIERAGRVVYANRSYARMVGAKRPAELLDRRAASLPKPQQLRRLDGQGGTPELQSNRIVFRRGSPSMAITIVRDVSDHKQLERQLRDSQKMEALGRLVGGVAHDFNNILAAITLYCDLLSAALPQGTQPAKHASEIRLAADQGAGLVRQLLAFARPQPTDLRQVSLNAAIGNITDMLRRLVGEDIDLAVHCAEPLPPVLVDPAQLHQIIVNLAMNSRDAMANGGRITLSTSVLRLARPQRRYPGLRRGSYVALTVTDTGCGMDAVTRARLFEPFFTTKPTGKGTGLGMSTVYTIVRHCGGTVAVDSEPGRGTKVTIVLPQARASAPHVQESRAPQLVGRGQTVLLVEDDDAIRTALEQMLSEHGYRVLAAEDPKRAAALAKRYNGTVSLLITDIVMPGRCGCDLARDLERSHPGLRVLFISGYPEAARSASAEAVLLHKPFSRDELARKIREVFSRSVPFQARDALFAECGEKNHDRH